MKKTVYNIYVVLTLLAACAGSEPETCNPENCPQGCCLEDRCLSPSVSHCGIGGNACLDCLGDGRADSCSSAGTCVCQATGESCPPGQFCTSSGCSGECTPDCAGKCAGADDGCGNACTGNDCPGCCDEQLSCLSPAEQDDNHCGSGGDRCSDCSGTAATDSCQQGACICAAAGVACPAGQQCSTSGCQGSCQPDCSGKCPGADDGCGNSCAGNDCPGCCQGTRCLVFAEQTDTGCGSGGEQCQDCQASGEICDTTTHTCQAAANDATFVSQQVPVTVNPGQQVDVTVTFANSGTSTWTEAAGYRLGAENPRDNGIWGTGRVYLDDQEAIAPGESKSFTFTVTTPAQPGNYDFQWRMLREGVEWFGDFSPNLVVTVGTVSVCESIRALANTDSDASAAIQQCIDTTPAGGILELPAGVYRIDHQLLVQARPITLRSEGKNSSMVPCAAANHDCAELRASPAFTDTIGILRLLHDAITVDHLVINGNKVIRRDTPSGQQCRSYHGVYGYNVQLGCDDCSFTNSVSRDALCGTCLEVAGARSRVTVQNSRIIGCGVHNLEGLWADGLTVHDASDSRFVDNQLADNTDVDLIFGGCRDCDISGNVINHGSDFASSSFAALMIHAWDTTSGDYQGTVVRNNTIDCGPQQQCGIGLYIGADAWYDTDTFGGSIHSNSVANAQFGLLIDDAHDLEIYDNPVSGTAGMTRASCGWKITYDYGQGQDSFNIDTSKDTLSTSYHQVDFDGCIPNWWNQ